MCICVCACVYVSACACVCVIECVHVRGRCGEERRKETSRERGSVCVCERDGQTVSTVCVCEREKQGQAEPKQTLCPEFLFFNHFNCGNVNGHSFSQAA